MPLLPDKTFAKQKFLNILNLSYVSLCLSRITSLHESVAWRESTRYKQNGDLLIKTLLHSATSGPKFHKEPLIKQIYRFKLPIRYPTM